MILLRKSLLIFVNLLELNDLGRGGKMQYEHGDCIQFESRSEIEKVIEVLLEWLDKNGHNDQIQRMVDLLDVMHMNW